MKIMIYKSLILILLSTQICGCLKDDIGIEENINEGKKVMVDLTLRIPPVETPQKSNISRAASEANKAFSINFDTANSIAETRSSGETKLYNLWLFQFNADGSANGAPYKVSDELTAVNDMVTLEVPLTVAQNQTLYLVALGRKVSVNFATRITKSALESWTFDYTTTAGGVVKSNITDEADIPMAGYVDGVKVRDIDGGKRGLIEPNNPDGFFGGIPIKRVMAKIVLRCKFDVSGYSLEGCKLINAVKYIRIGNPAKNDDKDTYIELSPELTAADAQGFVTVSWIVPQNKQGDVPGILSEADRYYKLNGSTPLGSAPPLGCYIEAWAYHNTAPDDYAIYQMYVGANNTSNFDVLANAQYNLGTTINTDLASAAADGRVRPYTAVQFASVASSWSIKSEIPQNGSGLALLRHGPSYDFDAHPDSRPITIRTKGSTVALGIYTDKDCTIPADPTTSWLRLSSSPNYTEAINNKLEPLSTELSTVTFLPTQLRFYLYSNEFIPGITDESNTTNNEIKRTMYLKIVTTKKGIPDIVKTSIFQFDQVQARYVGTFGGAIVDGNYTDALFADARREHSKKYDILDKFSSSDLPFGFYGIYLADNSSILNYQNGFEATKYMAENPDNHPVMGYVTNSGFKEPRKRPNGELDLYQYKSNNTYAARFCYDRNRDDDGNGKIDYRPGQPDNEFKWYVPSVLQTLAYSIFNNYKLYIEGSTMWAANPTNMFNGTQTTFTSDAFNTSYADLHASISMRCVRDVSYSALSPSFEKFPVNHVYTDEYGEKYPGINTSKSAIGENRYKNPNFYVTVPLFHYISGGKNAIPVIDKSGNQVYVKRIRRHSNKSSDNPNATVSQNFIISPEVIPDSTGRATTLMNWATAAGYLETANTQDDSNEASATTRGCHNYRGKGGKDPEGSWRMPLQKELMLMTIFEEEMMKNSAVTGFKGYGNGKDIYYVISATEYSTTSHAIVPSSLNKLRYTKDNNRRGAMHNALSKMGSFFLRCIKDIPTAP